MQPYTTIQGDTWDLVAHKKYGNEKQCHLIMQANPKHLRQGILFFPAGVVLNIPDGPGAEYREAPSFFEVPEMPSVPESLREIIASTGIMVSRRHGDLDGRNESNQHNAGSILYKDKSVSAALQGLEEKVAAKPPVIHRQAAASTVWTVVHNLGVRRPEYYATDTDGVEIVGAINWDEADANRFIIRFCIAVAGQVEVWV